MLQTTITTLSGTPLWRGTGPWHSMQADLADHFACSPDDVHATDEDQITVCGEPVAHIVVDSPSQSGY